MSAIPNTFSGQPLIPQTLRNHLFIEYKLNRTIELRNRIVNTYFSIVRGIAKGIHRRLPRHVEIEDLEQAGIFGLMQAIDRYEPARGIKFATYATPRVFGAIMDSLRDLDFVPRLDRKRKLKGPAMLSLSTAVFRRDKSNSQESRDTVFADTLIDKSADPEKTIDESDEFEQLIRTLPVSLKPAVRMRYTTDLSMKEISKRLEISESYVSVKVNLALNLLRSRIANKCPA